MMHNRHLRTVALSVYSCRRCGMCGSKLTDRVPFVCPVRETTAGFDHFYARGKTVIARGLLEGAIEPSAELAGVAYSCTLCGNCMTQCGSTNQETGGPLVDTTAIVEALRADLLSEHPEWVPQAYHSVLTATRQYNNPYGQPRSSKDTWLKGLNLPDARKHRAKVLLYAGCTMALSPQLTERARKAAGLLLRAQVDVAALGRDEPCCGSVQKRIGDAALTQKMIDDNIALFNSLGCETIITLCAGCTSMLTNEYRRAPVPLKSEVVPLVAYLPRLLQSGALELRRQDAGKPSRTVAYHDPCHLGRHLGIYDPPREVLRRLPGVALVERAATRENTICCGAGGGMRLFEGGALAENIGGMAVQEAARAGASALVTACPFCELNLAAAAQTNAPNLAVYDIIDLVHESLA